MYSAWSYYLFDHGTVVRTNALNDDDDDIYINHHHHYIVFFAKAEVKKSFQKKGILKKAGYRFKKNITTSTRITRTFLAAKSHKLTFYLNL